MDAQEIRDLTPAIFATRAGPALGASQTQTGDELAAQLTSGLGIDDVVDGFVRGALVRFMRVQCSQTGCYLLG